MDRQRGIAKISRKRKRNDKQIVRQDERSTKRLRDADLAKDADRGLVLESHGEDGKKSGAANSHMDTNVPSAALDLPIPYAIDSAKTAPRHVAKTRAAYKPVEQVDIGLDSNAENAAPDASNVETDKLPEHIAPSADLAAFTAKVRNLTGAIEMSDEKDFTPTLDFAHALALNDFVPKDFLQAQMLILIAKIKTDTSELADRNKKIKAGDAEMTGKTNEIRELKAQVESQNDFKNKWIEDLIENEDRLIEKLTTSRQEHVAITAELEGVRARYQETQVNYINLEGMYRGVLAQLEKVKQVRQ